MAKGLRSFPRPEVNFRRSPSREPGAEGAKPCGFAGRRGLGLPAFFAFFFFLATIQPFLRGPSGIQSRVCKNCNPYSNAGEYGYGAVHPLE